jgi:rhodanese-related sulfurtransferase
LGHRVLSELEALPVPVIAAVNGMACGGAFYMLGEVEFIIAAEHAAFFDPHVTYGMCATFEPLQLIDVREPAETAAGVIPGAQCIPLSTLEGALHTLSRDLPTVLVCKSGVRSARAARQLMAAGFTRVESLAGGMMRWQEL